MKRKVYTAMVVVAATLLFPPLARGWEYSAQVRPRMEWRDGYRTLPVSGRTDATMFISQRTRLAVGHRVDDKVSLFVQVQDVRTWGEESNTLNDYNADNFDVHQAYVDVTPNELWSFRVGRQELVYDGHRIMGNVDWTQQGRAHDAVRVALAHKPWTAHLVFAHSEEDQNVFSEGYSNPGNYRDLVLLWAQRAGRTYKASVIVLYDSYAAGPTLRYPERFTLGPRIEGTAGPGQRIIYRAEGYYQTGTDRIEDINHYRESDISAWLLGLRLGYDFGNVILTGWFDHVSGDDDITDKTYKAFDTPYPTNHKFYGWADYFLNIPEDTKYLGLQDFALKTRIKRMGPFAADLHAHYFRLAQADVKGHKNLGWELDAGLTLPVTEGTKLAAGWSYVAPDDALKSLKRSGNELFGANDGNWGWVMLDVNVK